MASSLRLVLRQPVSVKRLFLTPTNRCGHLLLSPRAPAVPVPTCPGLRSNLNALRPDHVRYFRLPTLGRPFHGHHGGGGNGNGAQSFSKSGAAFKGATEVKGMQMLKQLVAYVWPKDRPDIKRTVLVALGLLVGAKLLNISVPFFFKHAVDYLNTATGGRFVMH